MAAGQDSDSQSDEIRVTDRRRFTDTGAGRESGAEGDEASPDGAAEAPGPAGGDGGAEAASEVGEAAGGVSEVGVDALGIEGVFYIFWQSAMLSLGARDAAGQALPVNLGEARQWIDVLRLLVDKTAGNLTDEEDATVRRLVHEAQVRYVEAARQVTEDEA